MATDGCVGGERNGTAEWTSGGLDNVNTFFSQLTTKITVARAQLDTDGYTLTLAHERQRTSY